MLKQAFKLEYLSKYFFQVRLVLSYYKAKPPVMVSLTDLSNMDLIRVVYLTGSSLILPYLLSHLGLMVPPAAAAGLIFVINFSIGVFVMYLTIGVTMQYLHIHQRSASVFESLAADEDVQLVIRALVSSLGLLLSAWDVASNQDPTQLQIDLSAEHQRPDQNEGGASSRNINVVAVLTTVCCIAQVALRLLILWEKRKQAAHLGEGGGANQSGSTLVRSQTTYLALSLLALFAILSVVLASSGGDEVWTTKVKVSLGVGVASIILPMCFWVSNEKMKNFARKKYSKCFLGKFGSLAKNQVAPN